MKPSRHAASFAVLIALAAGGTTLAQSTAPKPETAATPAPAPASAPSMPTSSADEVDPDAKAALDKMSAYLGTLRNFEIKSDTTLDLVTQSGQRVQLDGTAAYKVRRPNGFQISVNTDWKKRTFYYDGKQFVVYAPEMGYYATADAPPTILQTLDAIEDKYGIALPIEDLFRWSEGTNEHGKELISAFEAGPATIDGAPTTHYVFRQKDVDWQVWIQDGAQPLPRKLVIIDRTDPALPAYTARLSWNLSPTLAASDFTFTPDGKAKAIRFSALDDGR